MLKAREAQNDEGFKIFPTNFGVSRTAGVIEPSRTGPNAGNWFTGPISTRVIVDDNTIKFVCTIPANSIAPNTTDTVREIYLYGTDSLNVDFLFAVGQPSNPLLYDPSGSLTLELELSLTDVDLTSTIVFSYTQATELSEHNSDPCAHPDWVKEMGRAGILPDAGCLPQAFAGQYYDKYVDFDGVKASVTYIGVTFTAKYTGVLGNSITLPFNNVKTTDTVRAIWNAANPDNMVEHNGTGLEVLAASTANLVGGSSFVADKALVYLDIDGVYKEAIADGTLKSKVAGWAYLAERVVKAGTFHTIDTASIPVGTDLFLTDIIGQEGKFGVAPTNVKIGFVMGEDLVLYGSQGGGAGGGGNSVGFDAVVSDSAGVNFYPTTQEAVDAAPNGGRILVDKLEYLDTLIDLTGKRLDIHFNGPEAGWSRFQGSAEVQKILFTGVPTSGTWRIEWDSQETIDLPYNATALAVQNAINAFTGTGLPVTVTGDYSLGFTISYTTLVDVPQPTFLHPGTNEIQRITMDNVPDDGTVRFSLNAQLTANFAWNDDALQLEVYFQALASVTDVMVSGSFATQQFDVEFVGVDGKQPWNQTVVNTNILKLGVVNTIVTMSTVQEGIYPASNLKIGAAPVIISVQTLQGGNEIGPTAAIKVGADHTRFVGLGIVENFTKGIDLNGFSGTDIEMLFEATEQPVINTGLTGVLDYHTDKAFGLSSFRDRTVGVYGDHKTLWDAVAAANAGDRIFVIEDQTIYTNQIINKDVEIVFLNGSQINVTGWVGGNLLSLGNKTRTRNLRMVVTDAGTLPVVVADQQLRPNIQSLAPTADFTPIAQSFVVGTSIDIYEADLYLEKFGVPVADMVMELRANNAGNPTGALLGTSDPIAVATLSTSPAVITYNFTTPVTLVPETYWMVLKLSSTVTFNPSNRINAYYDDNAYVSGLAKRDLLNNGSWATFGSVADLYFQVRGVNVSDFDTILCFTGTRGSHEDISVEASGVSTLIDHAFRIEAAATAHYIDGVITYPTATINNILTNTSAFASHNVKIRDRELALVHSLEVDRFPVQEQPVGVVDGINDTFTLSSAVNSTDGLMVMVDGVMRRTAGTWALINANTQIQFSPGSIPQLGQTVDVFYFPGGFLQAMPRQFAALTEGTEVVNGLRAINFGPGFTVTQDGNKQVLVEIPGAADITTLLVSPAPNVNGGVSLGTVTKGFAGLYLKDTTSSQVYKIEIVAGVITPVPVP